MDYVDYVRRKLDSTMAQIEAIACVDFPYVDPERALSSLREGLHARLQELDDAAKGGDTEAISSICKDINYKIVELHPTWILVALNKYS